MKQQLEEEFLENKFIGMLVIMLSAIIGLFSGHITADLWSSTMLFAFGIFSGAKVLSGTGLTFEKRQSTK